MLYILAGFIVALWAFGLMPTKARRMMIHHQRNRRARALLDSPRALQLTDNQNSLKSIGDAARTRAAVAAESGDQRELVHSGPVA